LDPLAQLERFRENRSKPERELSVAAMIRGTADTAARTHRRLGELIDLWSEIVPDDLASGTTVTALRGGVLHVTVDSSSRLYELDRLLRGGVTDELRRRYSGTLTRVKLSLG
jgi:hypothetical protein